MDFGKILDQWSKRSGEALSGPAEYTRGAYDKDKEPAENPASRRRRLLHKNPDGTIDLHGLTRDEAWDALNIFFKDAKNRGLEKLLIIHGKGNHTLEQGVLTKTVRDFIERCPLAGENGYSSASRGGTGSTWVIVKGQGQSTA
ncbi:MAG: Smr/MutS family protein [Spirochaetaceae bacterium]|jgi:DNA-nicking Smr family endonuclease|nr:Smr/MutS family protein [Spirochaetaceae bacterium]